MALTRMLLEEKKALTTSGPPFSKHREDFFQVNIALLLVIFTAVNGATSAPDIKCVTLFYKPEA